MGGRKGEGGRGTEMGGCPEMKSSAAQNGVASFMPEAEQRAAPLPFSSLCCIPEGYLRGGEPHCPELVGCDCTSSPLS